MTAAELSSRLAVLIEYLAELSAGACSIEEREIVEEIDPLWAQILAGITLLHETLQYQQEQARAQQHSLVEAARMAEEASAAKSRFLAAMSHEIRTPLNAIIGLSQLTLRGELSDSQRENLEIVNSAASGLEGLLTGVLDLSKLDAGKVDVEQIELGPEELLKQVAKTFALEARERGIAIELEVDPRVPARALGDPARLRQILSNLTSNAIKYTREGAVRLEVTLRDEAQGSSWLAFVVGDTGCGIADDDLEKIFIPFHQGASAEEATEKGAGLGLSLARGLTEALGGTLTVTSCRGAGSVFRCEVPLVAAPSGREEVEARADSMPTVDDRARFRGRRVLLVEDNRFNRVYACRFLERFGVTVCCATDGHQALEAFDSGPFDLILLDLRLPEIDGIEVARRIRALEKASVLSVPLVAMTADVVQETRRECVEVGFDDFLPKPVGGEAFHELLGKWLGEGAIN